MQGVVSMTGGTEAGTLPKKRKLMKVDFKDFLIIIIFL